MYNVVQIFLTMRCSGDCPYCIQGDIKRKSYSEVEYTKWIDYINNNFESGSGIGLIGGEPTIYNGFTDIITALGNKYHLTVTSNLKSKLFEDIDAFVSWAKPFEKVRWNFSFHPSVIDVDTFIERVTNIKINGINVDQVASVFTKEIEEHLDKLLQARIGFWLQTDTHLDDDRILHPNKEDMHKFGPGETGITDLDRYNYLCNGKKNDTVLCHTGKMLIDPSGNAYRCHRDLYKKENSIGNVFEETVVPNLICPNVGDCNPCDTASIKSWRI